MKILLTGASGFLGKYVLAELTRSGHEIYTLGRNDADYIVDIENPFILNGNCFDLVVHIAGKAHFLPKSVADVNCIYSVNVSGTLNLLGALKHCPPSKFVLVSTVAVYGLIEGKLISENHPLNAKDPYGHSKSIAENVVIEWCQCNKVLLTILRLPLIIGENPPGNLKSMIQGITKGYYFNISGGNARKSIVHAEDVSVAILPASEVGGIYHLTDGEHPNFQELSCLIGKAVRRSFIPSINIKLARLLARIGDYLGHNFPLNSNKFTKLTSDLTFDDSFARAKFGWKPRAIISGDILKKEIFSSNLKAN